MYLYGSLRSYIESASAGEPTPGGGSVAACAGALGVSMACMAANFTVGRKKFRDVEDSVKRHLAVCVNARDEMMALIDEDVKAYAAVSAAYGMPGGTPAEKTARSGAIQKALVAAMQPPLRTIRSAREALRAIRALAEVANPNLISDVGVAALLTEAALRAAKLNVEINLKSLDDPSLVASTRSEIDEAAREAAQLAQETLARVNRLVGGTP